MVERRWVSTPCVASTERALASDMLQYRTEAAGGRTVGAKSGCEQQVRAASMPSRWAPLARGDLAAVRRVEADGRYRACFRSGSVSVADGGPLSVAAPPAPV